MRTKLFIKDLTKQFLLIVLLASSVMLYASPKVITGLNAATEAQAIQDAMNAAAVTPEPEEAEETKEENQTHEETPDDDQTHQEVTEEQPPAEGTQSISPTTEQDPRAPAKTCPTCPKCPECPKCAETNNESSVDETSTEERRNADIPVPEGTELKPGQYLSSSCYLCPSAFYPHKHCQKGKDEIVGEIFGCGFLNLGCRAICQPKEKKKEEKKEVKK